MTNGYTLNIGAGACLLWLWILFIIKTPEENLEIKTLQRREIIWKRKGERLKQKKKNWRSRLLLITSQTGDLAFHFGRFPYFSSCPGLCLRVKTNQRHLYVEDCWPLKEPSQFRPACCVFSPLLLFFSLSLSLLFLSVSGVKVWGIPSSHFTSAFCGI